jgi:thiamine biosynthesis lipoprotein
MRKFLSLIACTLLALTSCAKTPQPEIDVTEFVLGTVCSIKVTQGGSRAVVDKAFARLRELEAELTVNKPGSRIDAVNAQAGVAPVKVGADAMAIVKRGLAYSAESGGAFDQTVGPLVRLWGIGLKENPKVPEKKEIDDARALIGWKDVVVDDAAGTIFLKRRGMGLDLGSASKGYAADEVAKILKAGGVKSAIIDLGGNILVVGPKPDGAPWRIGLQDPNGVRGNYIGVASLADQTMVTSGVYERFFIQDGVRYHHILDTTTGFPVRNGLTSVTVIAVKSFDADGVTTMLFALGKDKGLALARKLGIEAIMLDEQKHVYTTPGVSKIFQITDPGYSLAE